MENPLAPAKLFLSFVAVVLTTAASLPAQCSLSPPAELTGFAEYRWLGNSYRNMSCFGQARAAYAQMLKEAQGLPDSSPMKSTIIMWTPYYQEVVNGLEAFQHSDFETAEANLADVAISNVPDEMKFPAIMVLGDAMVRHFDGKYMPALKAALVGWKDSGGWKYQYYTFIVGLDGANASDRVAAITQTLNADLAIEERLADNVILLDALGRSGRLLEAQLLARYIEREIGRKAWNIDLRVYYLRVCYDLAVSEQAAGWGDASSRAQVYLSALREINVPR